MVIVYKHLDNKNKFACVDAIRGANIGKIKEYLETHRKMLECFELCKPLLSFGFEVIKRKRKRILTAHASRKKDDELWQHRYGSLFNDLEGEGRRFSLIDEFYKKLFSKNKYSLEARQSYLTLFTHQYMQINMHSYVVAEVLRPLTSILIFIARERLHSLTELWDDEDTIISNLELFMELDLRLTVLMAESNVYKMVDKRRASIENKLFALSSKAQSDRVQNHFATMTNDFSDLRDALLAGNTAKAKRIASSYSYECIWEIKEYIDNSGRQFSSHVNGRTQVAHMVFMLNHLFSCEPFSLNIICDNAIKKKEIKVEEFVLLKIIHLIIENAVAAKATTINLRFELVAKNIQIAISNNGEPMTKLEREFCFECFFSGRGEHGLGLFIAKQEAERAGGVIQLSRVGGGDIFVVSFPKYSKKSEEIAL